MKMAGSQAYGIPFLMLEMVLPSTHYSHMYTMLHFFSFHILNLFFKRYCSYFLYRNLMQNYVPRICMQIMEMLHVIIITNIRLVTLECKFIYFKNQKKLLYMYMHAYTKGPSCMHFKFLFN